MCWLATTSSPTVTAIVLLSSAPTASTDGAPGRRPGNGIGSGANPRARRRTCVRPAPADPAAGLTAGPIDRTTESSQRMWIPRS